MNTHLLNFLNAAMTSGHEVVVFVGTRRHDATVVDVQGESVLLKHIEVGLTVTKHETWVPIEHIHGYREATA